VPACVIDHEHHCQSILDHQRYDDDNNNYESDTLDLAEQSITTYQQVVVNDHIQLDQLETIDHTKSDAFSGQPQCMPGGLWSALRYAGLERLEH